jgi:putative resolvase
VNLHILDDQEVEKPIQEELVEDLIEIITSFSGKLYGTGSQKNKIVEEKVKGVLEDVANLPNQTEEDPTT